MNVLKYRVSLDMFDTHSQTTIKAKKCDSACQIHITLAKKGKIYNIGEGCYATFNAKKSDGNFIYDACTIEGNTIVYDFSSSMDENGICQVSACEGIVECEVTLYNADSKQLTSPRFTLVIDGTVYNGEEVLSTPQANALKGLINEASGLKKIVANALKGSASGEKAVAVNDVSPIEHEFGVNVTRSEIVTKLLGTAPAQAIVASPIAFNSPFVVEENSKVIVTATINTTDETAKTLSFVLLNTAGNSVGELTLPINTGKEESVMVYIYDTSNSSNYTIAYIRCVAPISGSFSDINVLSVKQQEASPEGVTISRYGKNLFGLTASDFNNGTDYNPQVKQVDLYLSPNTEYTLSSDAPGSTYAADIWVNGSSSPTNGVYKGRSRTVTTDPNGKMFVLVKKVKINDIFSYNYIQLELGSKATEYEPYIKPESATANEDGNVKLTSASPSMTLVSDTEGVVIDLEYNRDINKAFAELQALILEV